MHNFLPGNLHLGKIEINNGDAMVIVTYAHRYREWLCTYTTWLLLMNFVLKFKISEIQILFKTLPYYTKYKILVCIFLHII